MPESITTDASSIRKGTPLTYNICEPYGMRYIHPTIRGNEDRLYKKLGCTM
jgi:hypothetical protein